MPFYMTPEQVEDGLGDKIIHGFAASILGAATDLAEYRQALPARVSRATNRGLANWIHDAIRARVLVEVDGFAHVSLVDREPHFDVIITTPDYTVFKVRFKRHSRTGRITSYPTQGALDFIAQPQGTLPEPAIKIVHLCVGYEWDTEARQMGNPVMTLRDGSFEDVIWMIDLPVPPAASTGVDVAPIAPIIPTREGPVLPTIEVDGDERTERERSARE